MVTSAFIAAIRDKNDYAQTVYHPQKQKIRIVFDCAAEYRWTSLNKELMQGPDLVNSLIGEHIALMSDVEAMFSQVHIPKEKQDYQMFLWWANGDIQAASAGYHMKVHIFGATSSPSCANYPLKKSTENTTDRCVQNIIQTGFYVDDMLV
ncbi:uncharacterized protein LOC144341982 [Saccoglossus kowalevskii]